jgi:hypothetical protein
MPVRHRNTGRRAPHRQRTATIRAADRHLAARRSGKFSQPQAGSDGGLTSTPADRSRLLRKPHLSVAHDGRGSQRCMVDLGRFGADIGQYLPIPRRCGAAVAIGRWSSGQARRGATWAGKQTICGNTHRALLVFTARWDCCPSLVLYRQDFDAIARLVADDPQEISSFNSTEHHQRLDAPSICCLCRSARSCLHPALPVDLEHLVLLLIYRRPTPR